MSSHALKEVKRVKSLRNNNTTKPNGVGENFLLITIIIVITIITKRKFASFNTHSQFDIWTCRIVQHINRNNKEIDLGNMFTRFLTQRYFHNTKNNSFAH